MTFEKIESVFQAKNPQQEIPSNAIDFSDKKLTNLMQIIIPLICLALIALCVLAFCFCRRKDKTGSKNCENGTCGGSSSIGGSSNFTSHTKLRMSNGSVAMKSKTLQTKYSQQSGKTSSSKSSIASSQINQNIHGELNPFLQQQHQLKLQQQHEFNNNNNNFFYQQTQQLQQIPSSAIMIQNEVTTTVKQYSANNIRFLQEIGKGRYGSVFIGELIGSLSQTSVVKCVIKTLNDNNDQIVNSGVNCLQHDFVNEVNLYSSLRHRNLSNLLGICATNTMDYGSCVSDMDENDEFFDGKINPKCMIMEYLTNCDLHEYLMQRSCANQSTLSMSSGSTIGINSNISRNIHDFLFIAQQVSCGMEYLIKQNFVHKDLAARNIQMGDNLMIKISDIGQYKEKYTKDYYKFQNKLLPVRWMSPESLLFGRYAQDTDVWSYGVLLWEIFNYACTPYSGCTNPEVIQMIRDRQLLMIPDECPQRVYQLMLECWHENSVQRPTFTDIVSRLKNWDNYYTFHGASTREYQPVLNTNMINSYSSNSQNSKASNGGCSNNINNTGSTAISSTPPLSSIPQAPCNNHVLTGLPPLPLPPNINSPNRIGHHQSSTFRLRQASPPSSTTSSTRIYRECEASNTMRNSQKPLLFATTTSNNNTPGSTTVTSILSNNNNNNL